MTLGFDTERADASVAALLIYVVYRSRDVARLKVSLDMWSRIERFVKAAAKRADSLPTFIERLMPRLGCEVLRPVREAGEEQGATRDFASLTSILDAPPADPHAVLRVLHRETSLCVLLVRERLERERVAREAAKAAGKQGVIDEGAEFQLELFEAA
ncbi:conserved protein of unknown function (plasmid) [Rhodovastum atsumiense]|uniref:Uncharacterized protein n=1 Tax=Rhodovastum atsumiense TaxID=504468 RepID=A0A5M6IU52_9PROT|nr:hypothetical protein [Rhodovastum atsumiense]KAA5611804.1 hypothetical protein F1189_12245 [Rhodovastum atsumiense]CAH2606088.1 conserved protein of unknown function [Rhodovastum atsumiense]